VTFSRETTERIRCMLHGEAKPVRAEVLEVFAYVVTTNLFPPIGDCPVDRIVVC
jgi:hypothetical protein